MYGFKGLVAFTGIPAIALTSRAQRKTVERRTEVEHGGPVAEARRAALLFGGCATRAPDGLLAGPRAGSKADDRDAR